MVNCTFSMSVCEYFDPKNGKPRCPNLRTLIEVQVHLGLDPDKFSKSGLRETLCKAGEPTTRLTDCPRFNSLTKTRQR